MDKSRYGYVQSKHRCLQLKCSKCPHPSHRVSGLPHCNQGAEGEFQFPGAALHPYLTQSLGNRCRFQSLVVQYGQVDIDANQYREAAAKRVGLTIPDRVPLEAQDYASKYDLASKLSQLKGVAGLKAQLYGIESVLPKKSGASSSTSAAGKKTHQSKASGPSLEDILK